MKETTLLTKELAACLGKNGLDILLALKLSPSDKSQLAKTLDVSVDTVDRNLLVLEKHGLIKDDRNAQRRSQHNKRKIELTSENIVLDVFISKQHP